eukprot:NODE_3_length_80033_cov_0.932970.p67 type:complete len:123 gc:universal NODE_3_length_80033_cov_0.932970:34168-34536(+)
MYIGNDLYSSSFTGEYSIDFNIVNHSSLMPLQMLKTIPSEKKFEKRKRSHADVEKIRRKKLKEAFEILKSELWESPNVASAATRRHTLDQSLQMLIQLKNDVSFLEQINQQLRIDFALADRK